MALDIRRAALQANLYLKSRVNPSAQRRGGCGTFKNSCARLYRLNCATTAPKFPMLKTSEPQNVTIFGNRAFKEVIKGKMRSYGGALTQCDWCP